MKTPEEIKKGLECCKPLWKSDHWKTCDQKCPYTLEDVFCRNVLNSDAIDYIRQLKAQVPKWISVKDRMPSEGVSVAVYINEGNGAYWIQTAYLNGGKWRIPGEYVVDRNITHWMPMPEPPKEDA